MLQIGYNNSRNHLGSKTHCEKPERTHTCIDQLTSSLPKEIFITNTTPRSISLNLLIDTHTNDHVNSLMKFISDQFMCRKCNNKLKSDKLSFDEFIEKCQQCKYCKEKLTTNDIYCYLDQDTYFTNSTFEIILEAIGVLKTLIDGIKNGTTYGFALIRPPGHHCNNAGSGFCVANNVVIASKYAQSIGFEKIFIFDIDFHHGDGTENLIKDLDNISFCSIHAFGTNIYPGTGSTDKNSEKILNIPIDVTIDPLSREHVDDDYYLKIVNGDVHNFITKDFPDMIIISCGFDGHKDDLLEGFNLTDNAYVRIVEKLKTYNIPLLFVTEGGYNVNAIASTVKKMVNVMTFN